MNLRLSLITATLLPLLAAPIYANADDTELEKIIVTGDFQQESIQTLSASASLFSENEMNQRGATYLDEMLASAANVNFAAGASRGRYIQIRGVGLRSQFVDPINPSVGLVIDGINYSGLGGSSLLFDIDQVEIYRGPQGTRFGADGMAGMIQMQSANATSDPSLKLHLGAGTYNSHEAGLAASTGLTDDTSARVSYFRRKSDGYVDNLYLDKPTQDQDEQVARFKLNSQLTAHLNSELNLHYIDINNGYDAFTLDNSRNSLADQPGEDNQQSYAIGLNNTYTGFDAFDVNLNLSAIDTELFYSFDEDWVCNDTNKPQLCAAGLHPDGYSSTDIYSRDRDDQALDLQFTGKAGNWVAGIYYQNRDVDLERQYTWLANPFASTYETNNMAAYGQLATAIGPKTTLITGLRVEQYQGDYTDSNGFIEETDDIMLGGKIALEYQVIDRTMIYTSITRGYKAGGINSEALAKAKDEGLSLDADFFKQHTSFDPEYLWSGEFGVKGSSLDDKFTLRLAAFYMHRDNIQLKSWQVSDQQFTGYVANASSGSNYGLEIEGSYLLTDNLLISGSAGYLDTKINDFVTKSGLNQDGREQAQAPKYQYAFSARYNVTDELYAMLGVEGKDDYYFSDSHNAQAPNTNLVNASLGYEAENWAVRAWARNVFDETVPTRGFEFGNNPLDGYTSQTYIQLGEPRVAGVTFTLNL
ncbi:MULTISPECIES: TonB-dependent receptor [Pseudoalteromonas]|uniref:TonB-dependent receptor n=1 Tax=Pseudoalteromonas TaxID=53246 RepID=UPI000C5BB249|nr:MULTISPECIES: TonB-dependent receptor [Pseudoalteromonas]MAY58305.1 TonB-dependent receptor [Pseudoalteromonas sp.]MDN3408919.1 TonB-dependent receptor [Pseudoalteromonas sp. APC 3894]MDN3416324.1 TonB-dependent receptor [Pseudoalteromonas sp. APC 3227]MDN3420022.1 TonB-dependent receptor [Pseudoalteromonas sp. APC 3895]MDN3423596.1 TonB-dependent receptor [Pseudoalteromonas sp. APC 3896]|tara:strand:+ start:9819 stop:11918 length:2100 start_codon:yes stop_codon:yes gene_type:complete